MAITSIAKPTKWFSSKPLNKLPFLHFPSPKLHKSPTPTPSTPTPKTTNNDTKFLQVFRFLDSNNDGKISTEELRAHLMWIGESSMSNEDIQRAVSEFNLNGDNLLDFKEFVRLMERGEEEEEEELRRVFEMFEVDKGCGCITPKGLQQVLKRLGGGMENTDEECEAMIRVFDLDGNGVLDFNEFRKMMMIN